MTAEVAHGRRIALARWVAVAFGLIEAFSATPPLMGSPTVPCALVAVIALYNLAATLAGRWGVRPERVVMAACFADVVLCSVWVFLGSNDAKDRSFILYLPVLLECAMLARWRGVLPASAGALLVIAGSLIFGDAHLHHAIGAGDMTFRLVTIVIIAGFAGGFASDTHRQHLALVDSASTDPLTGVLNRRALSAALRSLPRVPFAVVAIDVDNLKPINDEHGHEAGDLALRTTVRVISEIARSGDIVSRVGGDEFAVVLLALGADEALAVSERMRTAMHGASIASGRVRISIGVAVGAAGREAVGVWREADAALLEAKHNGGDRVQVAAGMTTIGRTIGTSSRAAITATIDSVIAEGAVDIVFQPVVSLATGNVTGYQARARPRGWREESVEPLFRTARQLGRAPDLDWVCRRAALASLWKLPRDSTLFLPVTAGALLDPVHDVDQMLLLLDAAGAAPSRLVLELTERETIGDRGRLRRVLATYREHGFRVALDDVGEGRSTLKVLAATVPDYLKLTRGLAANETRGAQGVIAAAVAFAARTNASVIAEGVDSEEMATRLRGLGVSFGQGNWLARPAWDIDEVSVRGAFVRSPAWPERRASPRS
ncbi:MAG: GGDEF and EAL domain-containing protein [Candidatus Dormibacteraeota bacterium]|uniref:GGDEF and EAL domain-containing protein n=1 Tax=Candidatus Amunia macphersoniae TaxID=3127014 RepID=A0A934NEQ6_9BACT|nr:GGDEF and EAL domain-containing protein [Candidatus Dormibacteraeota bacterium]